MWAGLYGESGVNTTYKAIYTASRAMLYPLPCVLAFPRSDGPPFFFFSLHIFYAKIVYEHLLGFA
jgi:hypothetical protein